MATPAEAQIQSQGPGILGCHDHAAVPAPKGECPLEETSPHPTCGMGVWTDANFNPGGAARGLFEADGVDDLVDLLIELGCGARQKLTLDDDAFPTDVDDPDPDGRGQLRGIPRAFPRSIPEVEVFRLASDFPGWKVRVRGVVARRMPPHRKPAIGAFLFSRRMAHASLARDRSSLRHGPSSAHPSCAARTAIPSFRDARSSGEDAGGAEADRPASQSRTSR